SYRAAPCRIGTTDGRNRLNWLGCRFSASRTITKEMKMRVIQTAIRHWPFCLFFVASTLAQSLLTHADFAEQTGGDNERKKELERVLGREVKLGVGRFRLKQTFEDAAKLTVMPDQQFALGLHYYERRDFTNAFHCFEKGAT